VVREEPGVVWVAGNRKQKTQAKPWLSKGWETGKGVAGRAADSTETRVTEKGDQRYDVCAGQAAA